MKKYSKEITFGVLIAAIFAGLLFWFINHEPDSFLKIGIASLAVLIAAYAFIRQILTRKRDQKEGVPTEDEFTVQAKLHAGNQAFHYSLYLWFLIFIFHTSFSNQQEMLGIGILGSALIYGISLWYHKSSGDFSAE